MKKISQGPASLPRLNSLRHRLQKDPGTDDEPRLDQLMIFLEDTPLGVTNRWVAGAEMCAGWGIACSHTAVYRLFRSYVIEWRTHRALQMELPAGASLETFAQKAAELLAQRTLDVLADPHTSAATVVSLARVDLRRKALALAREKYSDVQHEARKRERAERHKKVGDEMMAEKGTQIYFDTLKRELAQGKGKPPLPPAESGKPKPPSKKGPS